MVSRKRQVFESKYKKIEVVEHPEADEGTYVGLDSLDGMWTQMRQQLDRVFANALGDHNEGI